MTKYQVYYFFLNALYINYLATAGIIPTDIKTRRVPHPEKIFFWFFWTFILLPIFLYLCVCQYTKHIQLELSTPNSTDTESTWQVLGMHWLLSQKVKVSEVIKWAALFAWVCRSIQLHTFQIVIQLMLILFMSGMLQADKWPLTWSASVFLRCRRHCAVSRVDVSMYHQDHASRCSHAGWR